MFADGTIGNCTFDGAHRPKAERLSRVKAEVAPTANENSFRLFGSVKLSSMPQKDLFPLSPARATADWEAADA
jgi:hypothetical protein